MKKTALSLAAVVGLSLSVLSMGAMAGTESTHADSHYVNSTQTTHVVECSTAPHNANWVLYCTGR